MSIHEPRIRIRGGVIGDGLRGYVTREGGLIASVVERVY